MREAHWRKPEQICAILARPLWCTIPKCVPDTDDGGYDEPFLDGEPGHAPDGSKHHPVVRRAAPRWKRRLCGRGSMRPAARRLPAVSTAFPKNSSAPVACRTGFSSGHVIGGEQSPATSAGAHVGARCVANTSALTGPQGAEGKPREIISDRCCAVWWLRRGRRRFGRWDTPDRRTLPMAHRALGIWRP